MTTAKQVYPNLRVPGLKLLCDDTRILYARDLLESFYGTEKQILDAIEVIRQLSKGTKLVFKTEYVKDEDNEMYFFIQ